MQEQGVMRMEQDRGTTTLPRGPQGRKLHILLVEDDQSIASEVRDDLASRGYVVDHVVGDEVATTSRFTGGGASFNTTGASPAQSTFNIGAALNVTTDEALEFGVNYDFAVKSDYTAHSGFLRLAKRY